MSYLVSIIIPTYNVEEYIDKCINSLLSQTYTYLEFIFVDDGSTDSTLTILKKYSSIDSRIKVIIQDNSGPSCARNKGIQNAQGQYIMFVDSDDYIDVNYVKNYIDAIDDNTDLVIGGFTYVKKNSEFKYIQSNSFSCDYDSFINNYYAIYINNRLLFGPYNKLYKRTLIRDYNLMFDPTISIREDGFFVLAYLSKTHFIKGINYNGYYYIQHDKGTSLVSKYNKYEKDINRDFFKYILSFISNKELSREEISLLFPIYLNMDISSIRKYYICCNPSISDGLCYIKEILNDKTFSYARNKYIKANFFKGLKYYRISIIWHFINKFKR